VALGQAPTQDKPYVISSEDVLTISVRDVPEASGDYLVRKDGFISYPLVGEVKVSGLSTTELEAKLAEGLKKEIRNPEVTVNVKSASLSRLYVLGAVKGAGVLDYKPKWRITEAIAAAGGLSSAPERTTVLLFRVGEPTKRIQLKRVFVEGDDTADVPVQPGDVLNVQADVTVRIQVVGQVAKPGTVEILDGQGAAEALAGAGGSTSDAKLSTAMVVRGGKEYPVDLYSVVSKGQPQKNMTLVEGDTLYIPTLLTRIAVMGSVAKPGPMVVPDGQVMTLSLAIAMAGGPTAGAKLDGVDVIHVEDGKPTRQTYNFKNVMKGIAPKTSTTATPQSGAGKSTAPIDADPVLQNNDIVFIASSGKVGSRDLSSLGSLFGIFNFIRYFP
jgi:polysaccharide export outer membrane protein